MNKDQALGKLQSTDTQRARQAMMFRIGVLGLAVGDLVLLLKYGLTPGISAALGALSFIPVYTLIIATTSATGVSPRLRMKFNILTPVAGGLQAVAVVVGTAYFRGSVAWWVPAALVSVAPFLAIAQLHRMAGDSTELSTSRG
jgi:hypothetical protein